MTVDDVTYLNLVIYVALLKSYIFNAHFMEIGTVDSTQANTC